MYKVTLLLLINHPHQNTYHEYLVLAASDHHIPKRRNKLSQDIYNYFILPRCDPPYHNRNHRLFPLKTFLREV